MELLDTVFSLCGTMTVSGKETQALLQLQSLCGDTFDEIRTDAVGNILLIRRCGKAPAAKILIDTHLDEIGMIVSEILSGGFLRITPIGGLDPSIMQACDVTIYGKKTIRGVIASTPPHLRKADDGKKLVPIDELLIDTGYSEEELKGICPLGTPVGFSPRYTKLLNGRFCGKSLDNKACGAAAICALAQTPREMLAADVYLLFSCHEETVHIGGVSVGAFAVQPDYAMVVDVNLARVPGTPDTETVPFGGGVSLAHSAITDRRLTRMVTELCTKEEIPFYGIAAPSNTGTNTPALNLAGRGVPVVDVGLPLKNMHTSNEVACEEDMQALISLIRAFVCSESIREVFGV